MMRPQWIRYLAPVQAAPVKPVSSRRGGLVHQFSGMREVVGRHRKGAGQAGAQDDDASRSQGHCAGDRGAACHRSVNHVTGHAVLLQSFPCVVSLSQPAERAHVDPHFRLQSVPALEWFRPGPLAQQRGMNPVYDAGLREPIRRSEDWAHDNTALRERRKEGG
jgi:hypothetical protein